MKPWMSNYWIVPSSVIFLLPDFKEGDLLLYQS